MAKEIKKLKGENLGICNPFPGTTSACLYEKQSDGSIKPAIWLTKPAKTSKEDFDLLINGLNFRVIGVRNQDGSEPETQDASDSETQEQQASEQVEEMPAD